ncbi:hypothetical protein DdX_03968 [Ditylenchus destructor]|uniref:Uncharacterized protein n=1 Tax=Ditylenchus destructor TaxID=166010 RepID=A0AAD4NBB5_9BILA|nr:hypothetical protein DdX_03968 [Ditylenchus destructor]
MMILMRFEVGGGKTFQRRLLVEGFSADAATSHQSEQDYIDKQQPTPHPKRGVAEKRPQEWLRFGRRVAAAREY